VVFDGINVLDEILPLVILGVGFAGIDHLQPTGECGQLSQPLDVLEQQVYSFVGCSTSGKPQSQ